MKRILSILLIAMLLLTGCTKKETSNGLTKFTTCDLDGNTQTESIFKGKKLTMVNLWGTYCGPCIQEMPALAELHEEYADKGFQVVGIIGDVSDINSTSAQTAHTLLENAKANYVNLLPSKDMQKFLEPFIYVPTTVFLNEKGEQIGEEQIGARSKASWQLIIDEMLEEVA